MGDSPARKARLKAAHDAKMAELRGAGAACGNCTAFKGKPYEGSKGNHCELLSDFHGYVIVKADGLCTKHERRAQPRSK